MAVLENRQKKGIGEALVKQCEKHCAVNNIDLIWFNARTTAVGFYKKMNYETMEKHLTLKMLENII